jgi:hypothetical protein
MNKHIFYRIFSYFLLIIFLFDSCTRDSLILNQSPNVFKSITANSDLSISYMANEFSKLRQMRIDGKIGGEEDIFNYYIKDKALKDTIGKRTILETMEYKQLGYEDYLTKKVRQGIFTSNQQKVLLKIKADLENLTKSEFSEEKVNKFFDQEVKYIQENKDIKEEDKYLPIHYCNIGKVLVKEYKNQSKNKLNTRGCNFWEGFLCVFLTAVVAITIGAILAVACSIGVGCNIVSSPSGATGPVTPEDAFILGAIIGVIYGIASFYETCCSWFDDQPKYYCGCSSGFNPVCPPGYSFDGCNCARNEVPPNGTHAFYWDNGVYYTPLPGGICPAPAQFFDSQNCYVGHLQGWETFIYNNFWYTKPKCQM